MRLELLTVDWESGLFQLFGKSGLQSSKLIILPDPDPPEFWFIAKCSDFAEYGWL